MLYPLDPLVAILVHPVLMVLVLAYVVGGEGEQNSLCS